MLGVEVDWGIPPDLTFWDAVNSPVMGTVIGAIATTVAALVGTRIIDRVTDQTEQRKTTAAAEEKRTRRGSVDEVVPSENELKEVIDQAQRTNGVFSDASTNFKLIRDSVMSLVASIQDGRRRRKYAGLKGTDIRDHVFLLWQDDVLGLSTAEKLSDAISDFYSYRTRPNEIPRDVAKRIKTAAELARDIASKL